MERSSTKCFGRVEVCVIIWRYVRCCVWGLEGHGGARVRCMSRWHVLPTCLYKCVETSDRS